MYYEIAEKITDILRNAGFENIFCQYGEARTEINFPAVFVYVLNGEKENAIGTILAEKIGITVSVLNKGIKRRNVEEKLYEIGEGIIHTLDGQAFVINNTGIRIEYDSFDIDRTFLSESGEYFVVMNIQIFVTFRRSK